MPDFTYEAELGRRVCGVDEVGRGPLAGPVVAVAVLFDRTAFPADLRQIDDSKRLPAAARVAFAHRIRAAALVGVGAASVAEIDRLNILQASLLAMRRAVAALGVIPDAALIDGNRAPRLDCPSVALVKGDALSLSVAAASIVAKVLRDQLMAALAMRYPAYGWNENAGYPTEFHRAALVRHGATAHHRRSFGPVRAVLTANDDR